jgi:hypothetical protein
MDPVTPVEISVCVTRPVLWSAGTGVIQYAPLNEGVAACDIAIIDSMLITKSALRHITRGFRIFFVRIEFALFLKMFVFTLFSLPELLNLNTDSTCFIPF